MEINGALTGNDPILAEDLYAVAMEVMACPAVPGREHHVRRAVLALLEGLPNVQTGVDEFGNITAVYDFESAGREAFRLVAHMDHPGFVVKESELRFRGGMDESYFLGQNIRFFGLDSAEPLGERTITSRARGDEDLLVEVEGGIPEGARLAVWALPPPSFSKRKELTESRSDGVLAKPGDALFLATACDDLIEVCTMVALLRRLSRTGAKACVHALFTRSEETGFYGALAALEAKAILPPVITLSLEVSPAQGAYAAVGDGPILRVGDRLSVFNSDVTYWLQRSLAAWHRDAAGSGSTLSPFQRKLMSGGSCEGSVFQAGGWPTGALCVPMYNFHNMGGEGRLEREAVSVRDWQSLYEGLYYLATQAESMAVAREALEARFTGYREAALVELREEIPT